MVTFVFCRISLHLLRMNILLTEAFVCTRRLEEVLGCEHMLLSPWLSEIWVPCYDDALRFLVGTVPSM